MREQDLQRKIIKYLKEIGAYVVKVSLANRNGVPDLLCCLKGQFLALEVKVRGKPTELQNYNIEAIKRSGGKAFVIYDLNQLKKVLSEQLIR